MTVGLYILRAKQAGFTIAELDEIDRGDFLDVLTESSNDNYHYPILATQDDFDRF